MGRRPTARCAGCELSKRCSSKLQTLDPVGVFARSVKECLALQLRDRDRLDPMMQRLLDNLDLIAEPRPRNAGPHRRPPIAKT